VNGAAVLRDLVYSEVIGFRPLSLDLYRPERLPAPVILFVHGGGWRMGSKAVFTPTISAEESFGRIVDAGFAIASVDYRLSGEAHFPAQVDDVRAALAWVREHAAEYDLDSSRIVLWGESAGATLAALVGLEPSSGVLGVIDWYGPSDLIAMAEKGTAEEDANSRETEWLGRSARDDPDTARAASPVFAVHDDAPPFFIAHGDTDRFVPVAQSEALADALRDQGVDVRFTRVAGASHMWRDLADPAALVGPAIDFAQEMTKKSNADHD
jgi:acetyl esterase/lipase